MVQFTRQLLAKGNIVHATARKPQEAKGLLELEGDSLKVEALDTSEPESIQKWAASLRGQAKFDVRLLTYSAQGP